MKAGDILPALRETSGFVSGESLAKRNGTSRAAIWKKVHRLRAEGYRIISRRRVGYQLQASPDRLTPEEVLSRIRYNPLLKRFIHQESAVSTQEALKRLALEGAPEGTLIIAETQTAGRGRMGRAWDSPPGGLWMSLLLRPKIPPQEVSLLTMVAGLSVAEALRALKFQAELKWPNDVLIEGKKVCGILTESSAEMEKVHFVTLGIGINVRNRLPAFLRRSAASLNQFSPEIRRLDVLEALLGRLEENYKTFCDGGAPFLLRKAWRHSAIRGKRVRVRESRGVISGVAAGLSPEGALLLRRRGETLTVRAGDVLLL